MLHCLWLFGVTNIISSIMNRYRYNLKYDFKIKLYLFRIFCNIGWTHTVIDFPHAAIGIIISLHFRHDKINSYMLHDIFAKHHYFFLLAMQFEYFRNLDALITINLHINIVYLALILASSYIPEHYSTFSSRYAIRGRFLCHVENSF